MTEPNRQSGENEERIIEIEIERLRPFKEHPFQVKDDKEMFLLQESIEKYGILNPLIVRPVPDGYYEIISGHRRKHAAEKLGYRKVPVIIRVLSEDDSILSMHCPKGKVAEAYLDSGKMYVLDDNGVKCECVITDEKNDILEIKNIATVPEYQGKGYARALIEFIVNNYREQYAILQVGTGDSLLTIPFYEKCGFVRSHIISNFFTDNYDHPIYESGVQLVDMVYLQRPL